MFDSLAFTQRGEWLFPGDVKKIGLYLEKLLLFASYHGILEYEKAISKEIKHQVVPYLPSS